MVMSRPVPSAAASAGAPLCSQARRSVSLSASCTNLFFDADADLALHQHIVKSRGEHDARIGELLDAHGGVLARYANW